MLLMEYPPSKRLKEYHHDAVPDPFSDEEDFTQDDLNEIDVIASQAITRNIQGTVAKTPVDPVRCPGGHSKPEGRRTFALSNHPGPSRGVEIGNVRTSHGRSVTSGNGQSVERNGEKSCYSKLEAQHATLLEKLKEVEEEILMKNGEIRVLRDSIRLANQEKEQQRLALYHQEKEKSQAQSDREKELSKKIQSLQSELHFKEAEMNKMKSKLQHSERGGKLPGTPSAKNSPKMTSTVTLQQDRETHVSPGGSPFITKETFTAQLSVRPSPLKSCPADGTKQTRDGFEKETPINTFPVQQLQQGSVLLNLLLQHPLDPSSLGLCHLLCISPDSLCGLLSQHGSLRGSLCGSSTSSSSACSTDARLLSRPHAHFNQLQSLAMSGLSALALGYPTHPKVHTKGHLTSAKSCPGAVHLLPLLEHHISLFCQTLETMDSSVKSPLRGISLSSSSVSPLSSNIEETLLSQEDIALACVKAVRLIVSQSDEAVQTLLSQPSQEVTLEMEALAQSNAAPSNQQPGTSKGRGASEREREERKLPQHPLFKRLVQLADPTYSCSTTQKEALVIGSLATLSLLAQRADEGQLRRFDSLMASQSLSQCLSLDSTFNTIFLSVRLLTILVSSDDMAEKLCSHLYSCPFLKIFQLVISRPDKSTTEDHWFKLEIEMIRFLSRLFIQKASLWTTYFATSCQCNSEVVRTLVVLLHRQWLRMHSAEWRLGQQANWTGPGVTLLREALMLLYWLLQNDSNFSDHCLDVMHMYEQMIPAIRDTFRMVPNLTESEELALDEICRSVAENVEDMEVDAGF
ncbi:ATR-interacting protein [Clupea harengus]|uniref:ATR-interacting protein n=1 Tax=Clupea harengus TaxID=7950 RepID=A0A6P8FFC3_CLUHA|nr:ATR-interacting protein [Clupea harengus]